MNNTTYVPDAILTHILDFSITKPRDVGLLMSICKRWMLIVPVIMNKRRVDLLNLITTYVFDIKYVFVLFLNLLTPMGERVLLEIRSGSDEKDYSIRLVTPGDYENDDAPCTLKEIFPSLDWNDELNEENEYPEITGAELFNDKFHQVVKLALLCTDPDGGVHFDGGVLWHLYPKDYIVYDICKDIPRRKSVGEYDDGHEWKTEGINGEVITVKSFSHFLDWSTMESVLNKREIQYKLIFR